MKSLRYFAIVLLPLSLWSLPTTNQAIEQSINSQELAAAKELYEKNCARCHGSDGRARRFRGRLVGARNLADAKWQEKATDEQIVVAIKNGPRAMPSFEKKFSEAEIESLVRYVRSLKQEEQGDEDE